VRTLGRGSDFSVYLTRRVDRRTVLVTALASAVAVASLVFSPLPFSRGLGLALGAGILVTTALAWSLTRSTRASLPPAPPGVTAEFVGLPVAAVRGYQLLSGDRYLGNVIGMLAAAAVLLCGLRRRSDGLRALAAAALSTGWGLALLTASGSSISPLTAALGSLATVTAAEFAVLQATALRQSRPSVSRAVLAAGSAATIGYLSLLVSGLALLRQFGLLLAAVVLLSYAAARLLLWLAPPRATPTEAVPAAARKVTVSA
jgi:hypothetical protein